MALKLERSNSITSVGIKVAGDLGDVLVTDVASDCDDSSCTTERKSKTLCNVNAASSLPPNLLQNSAVPSFGRVAITNSENVQIGNNTFFNGPVTVKQIVQSKSGVENPSYVKNDEENIPGSHTVNGKYQQNCKSD